MTSSTLHFQPVSIQRSSPFFSTDDHSIGEISMFPDITYQTVNMYPQIEIMLGDVLYSNRRMCSITEKYGIKPYFLQRANATLRARVLKLWKIMLYSFIDNTHEWLEQYHMRSISESINSMMKRKMPFKVRKKLPQRKKTEETLKINVHNLRQYSYMRHTNP